MVLAAQSLGGQQRLLIVHEDSGAVVWDLRCSALRSCMLHSLLLMERARHCFLVGLRHILLQHITGVPHHGAKCFLACMPRTEQEIACQQMKTWFRIKWRLCTARHANSLRGSYYEAGTSVLWPTRTTASGWHPTRAAAMAQQEGDMWRATQLRSARMIPRRLPAGLAAGATALPPGTAAAPSASGDCLRAPQASLPLR